MRSVRLARRLVRLYPRAWRARYEDEMLAVVDARPVTLGILLNIARGCAREWRSAMLGRPSPWLRVMMRQLLRMAAAIALAAAIARSSWWLTDRLVALGKLAPPDHLVWWSLGLGFVLLFRGFMAQTAACCGENRFAVTRPELLLWMAVAFSTVMLERLDQIYLERLPWNATLNLGHVWSDQALGLVTPLMMLLCGSKGAAIDYETARLLWKRRPDVPTSVLGLNR